MLLAGDIGGTHSRLGVFSIPGGLVKILKSGEYKTIEFNSLEEIISKFVHENDIDVKIAVLAVAGPVKGGVVNVTNLPWKINSLNLSKELGGIQVKLINDLVGMSYFVAESSGDDVEILNDTPGQEHGPIALIAPGTGLGEAYLTWNGTEYNPFPSEGGHTDFAPLNEVQTGLLKFLQKQFGRVSYERVCSGLGILNIYDFFKEDQIVEEPEWLRKKIEEGDDPVPIIFDAAEEGREGTEICSEVVDTFVDILAAEAGNLALKTIPTGGLYIGGGIPPRILNKLRDKFMSTFLNKGRLADMLSQIPVYVIIHPNPALRGAAIAGKRMLSIK